MDRLLQSWVTQQAEIRPGEAAIVSGADSLSYSQLEVASNQLAHLLQNAGCQNGDRVCILMPKSAEAIVSMVGILKAGCLARPDRRRHPGSSHPPHLRLLRKSRHRRRRPRRSLARRIDERRNAPLAHDHHLARKFERRGRASPAPRLHRKLRTSRSRFPPAI